MRCVKERFTGKASFSITSHKVSFPKVNFKGWHQWSLLFGPNSNLGIFTRLSGVPQRVFGLKSLAIPGRETYLKELLIMKGWLMYWFLCRPVLWKDLNKEVEAGEFSEPSLIWISSVGLVTSIVRPQSKGRTLSKVFQMHFLSL